ncbi:seminal metalloprotease 1 [Drosophila pseudoobscura]|uniref:Metalloendopeptidase n=1 Tax=Drosophila pseudoobscura pseudoobscura TaxID=46245 RepID=A0A6I8VX08_DROPS|nr:seminal metalloprotease 1 [Drosophila pseudoobscura]
MSSAGLPNLLLAGQPSAKVFDKGLIYMAFMTARPKPFPGRDTTGRVAPSSTASVKACVCIPACSLTAPVGLLAFTASRDTDLIEKAMAAIASQTCVRFRRTRNAQEPQVVIQRKEAGCWSYVGFLGRQQQLLNLGERCMTSGTIQHEILHALGLFHTHCDPRRDQYVKIHPENLKPGYEHNFRLLGIGQDPQMTDFGLGYDYESLMHYGEYAFSRNGLPTIVPLRRGVRIGQAKGLSAKDVRKLNRMYCRGN